jgi:hypothetical protein
MPIYAAASRKSGANPDDPYRHRQAHRKSGDNRQGECAKQIYPGPHQMIYRHASRSTAAKVRSRHRHKAMTVLSIAALCPEGKDE